MALGLFAAACSSDEPAAGTAQQEPRELQTVDDRTQSGSAVDSEEPVGPAGTGEASNDSGTALDESHVDTTSPEQAPERAGIPTTAPAEEMMPDELNVAYLAGRPTAIQVAQAERTYDRALDLIVNWVPSASSDEMSRAMEAGDIDISYLQGLTSFASFVTGGSDLLLVGVAAIYEDADGIRVFDIISTSGVFAAEYPDIVSGFLQVTEDTNVAYNDDREPFIDIISEAAGMDREAVIAILDTFEFPEKDVQLSEAWLGGAVQHAMKEQMDSLAVRGEVEFALDSYGAFVDTGFLEAVD